MEVKKSDKADLDKRWGERLLLGLVFSLALLFAALELTTRPAQGMDEDALLDDLTQDLDLTPMNSQKDMVSAPGPAAAPKSVTDNMKVLPKAETAEETAPITSKLVVGDGEGAARASNVTEALPQVVAASDTAVLTVVEQLPEFPGGIVQFMKWLHKNLQYPAYAQTQRIHGKVVVSFIVNKDGTVTRPKIVSAADPSLGREVLRALASMPRWKPGVEKGRPCRTMVAIPVNFEL